MLLSIRQKVIRIDVDEDKEDEDEREAEESLSQQPTIEVTSVQSIKKHEARDYQMLFDKFVSSKDLPIEERCKIFNEFIEAKIKLQETSA